MCGMTYPKGCRCNAGEMKVWTLTDLTLAIDINGVLYQFPQAIESRVVEAIYNPTWKQMEITQKLFVDASKLPEELQLRIEEIEAEINALN